VAQASPHHGSGLGPAHRGGKASVGLLPSTVENRGVSAQCSPGKIGEGGGHEHRRRWPMKGNGRRGWCGVLTHWRRRRWRLGLGRCHDQGDSVVLSHEWRSTRRRVLDRWAMPPDRLARWRSQPMTGGFVVGYFQT
jgi:hypothetical protein